MIMKEKTLSITKINFFFIIIIPLKYFLGITF